jgi:preprotein translocase subunit SecG
MATVLLIIHVLIALALIGVVLLQRSEGGALGIGGGGGGFMTGRGAANFLTRATTGLAIAFFGTSLLLSLIGTRVEVPGSILDTPLPQQTKPSFKPPPADAPQQLPPLEPKKLDGPKPDEVPRVPQSQ